MPDNSRKMTVGCSVTYKHNKNGQCDVPQMSKGLLLVDEKCTDYELL